MEQEDQRCEKCAFWRFPNRWIDVDQKVYLDGECHKNPPATNGHVSYFPVTRSTTWCGEFKMVDPYDELGRKIGNVYNVLKGEQK